MRAGWLVAIAVLVGPGGPARADRLSASGFVGLGSFGDTELGNSWAPEQVPGTAAVLGARVGWLAAPSLVRRGRLALSLAIEAELALAASFTGGSSLDDQGRASYFAPVFGWRAHALLRQPIGARGRLALHAVLGAGGATVASSSPFMARETDPLGYAGLGGTFAISARWQLRLDARQGLMPGRMSSTTRVSELHAGLITTFGAAARRPPARPEPPPDPPDLAAADPDPPDPDGAGAGGPDPDPDGDGVVGAADACPMEPEDLDRFEDEDGCPDPDNDGDGIDDTHDVCPGEPETRNGYADADGCPDVVPEAITRALAGAAAAVRFERRRARVTPAARRALQPVLAMLRANADLAIVVTGAPDRAGGDDLARRRAEAVKWHLVDAGLAEDRIETAVGPAAGRSPIALTLRR